MNRLSRRPVAARILLFVFAILLIGVAAPSSAAAQDGPRVITFEEAVRLALDQNITLRQVANNVELDAREVFQRRMNFLPDVSFFSQGSRGAGFTQDQAGRNIQFTNQTLNGSFSSNVNLFRGFADVAALEQSKYQRDAGELSYDRSRQDVVFNVIDNFLLYVNAREQVTIHQQSMESQQQQLAQIEEFVNVGSRPISDLYQQQAGVAQAELQVLNAERDAELNKTRLIQVLHLDPFGDYEFAAPDTADLAISPQRYELDDLLRSAFAQRPDIDAQEMRIRAAGEGVRIAKSSYWPTINFGGSYRSSFSPDAEGAFFNQLDVNRGNSIGMTMSYPIFDRFNRNTNVQEAEVAYRNAALELEDVRQRVALQVRQAYFEYLSNEKRLDVTETQERAAGQALEAAQERYNVGAGTLVELTQAQAQYTEAASNRVQARYDFLFQSKLVDYFVGRIDPSQPLFLR